MASARSRWWLLETLRGGCALTAVRAHVCVTGERRRAWLVYLPSGAGRRSQVRRKLECAVSISSLTGLSPGSKRFLETTTSSPPRFLAMPLVMAHTNFESVKWAITRCAAPPLKVDWPKRGSAGQVKFIYRTSSTKWLKSSTEKQGAPLCVCVCVYNSSTVFQEYLLAARKNWMKVKGRLREILRKTKKGCRGSDAMTSAVFSFCGRFPLSSFSCVIKMMQSKANLINNA